MAHTKALQPTAGAGGVPLNSSLALAPAIMTPHENMVELFRLKGVLKDHRATAAELEYFARCLAGPDESIRTFAASVVLAEHERRFEQQARDVVQEPVAQRRIAGSSFVRLIFWEAVVLNPLSWRDTDAWLDLIERHLNPPEDRSNIPAILERIASRANLRAATVLSRSRSDPPA